MSWSVGSMEVVLGKFRMVITPYLQSELPFNLEDYGKKGSITLVITGATEAVPERVTDLSSTSGACNCYLPVFHASYPSSLY